MLDASREASLPLSYLVEIVSEYEVELLHDLGRLIESKRRELGLSSRQKTASPDKNNKAGEPE